MRVTSFKFGRYLEILVSYYFKQTHIVRIMSCFFQVDYKRLSEDLSKIVNMKGKISLGSFAAPVKKRWIVSNLSDLWKVHKKTFNVASSMTFQFFHSG